MNEVKTKAFLFTVRQALIILLGAVEDYLGIDRSIIPKHKKHGIIRRQVEYVIERE